MDKKLYLAGLGSLLFILLPFFFYGGPDWTSPPIYQQVWNFGHIIFFALLGAFVQIGIGIKTWRHILWVTGLTVLLGVAIEYVQSHIGRTASWSDVANDLAGFWMGLVWARRQQFKVWVRTGVTFLIVPAVGAVFIAVAVEGRQLLQFPQLGSFEDSVELQRIDGPGSLSDEFYCEGHNALKIEFTRGKHSGLFLNVFHGDWSAYRTLAMDFYNPDPNLLEVTLRISDLTHDRGANDYDDRFNRRLFLQPGWNPIRIAVTEIQDMPVDRQMNLHEIHTIGVYTSYLDKPRRVYWDNVRLE